MNMSVVAGTVLAALAAPMLSGCDSLPRSGPDGAAIAWDASAQLGAEASDVRLQYALIDINPAVLAYVGEEQPGSIHQSFGSGATGVPAVRIGVGDVVQVTIFEAEQGGLFIPVEAGSRPGNFVTLPQQTVDQSGTITVPYAGEIAAAGKTVPSVQKEIEQRLADRAIEPQAVVALVKQEATSASVVGEVNLPGTFPINPAGDRILDMIARAGGPKHPGYETYVTLQRKGQEATVFFDTLVRRAGENIYVAPGDTIYVVRKPRTFLAFGAFGNASFNGRLEFGDDRLSLAEAVGKAGGLTDSQAEPSQVYVFRIEDRTALEALAVDLSKFPPDQPAIPTIYKTNLRKADAMFVAQNFPVRDKDVLYISNASSVELLKFLNIINAITGAGANVGDAALIHDAFQSW